MDISGNKLRGKVINVSVGSSSNGSFGVTGLIRSSDGALSVSHASDALKCTVGNKPWIIMRFALCRGEDVIDGYDRDYLHMLGFRIQSRYDVLVAADVTTDKH